MAENLAATVKEICEQHGRDRSRMIDVVLAVQRRMGCVSGEAMELIARELSTHRVEVQSVVSFYAFLSEEPKGCVVIRLCDDIVDMMQGGERVADAFREELGVGFGETTPDGAITLERTPCIGMCDQAPAALVNDEVFTCLRPASARELAAELKKGTEPRELPHPPGDGNNAGKLIHSMVRNNIRCTDDVIFAPMPPGAALGKALAMTPTEVVRDVKTARLRGRGGAGFPTGMKWEFTRAAGGPKRYVVANADEGEPGTFKDRVILTECPDLLLEGMAIAGYAVGADEGILYLRAEYAYLRRFLEHRLASLRSKGLLGRGVCGKKGFDFDIRIQMGAGAYVCGEETALLSSCEGLRGDPRTRPPFPAQEGYMGCPTAVNNIETLCCAARILNNGAGWFAQIGAPGSPGTKVLSVSGDCRKPGVYELPFGVQLSEVLRVAEADGAVAVQVGGPSGQMVGPDQFDRQISYDDLATGGSLIVFGAGRDILSVVSHFLDFFIEESCGFCTPCRVGTVLLKERVDRIRRGEGEPGDLDYLSELADTVRLASRCGLGQTAANPVIGTLKNFRAAYEDLVAPEREGMRRHFDLTDAVRTAEEIAGRKSISLD